MPCTIFLVISKARLSFSYKWILKFQNCMFRELLVPIILSQVRFDLKTKLANRHINVGHCSSLRKEHFRHFSDRVTVVWRHQTMTSHFSLRFVSFKHHYKIKKCKLCILYKFYIIPSYIQRDIRVVSELFYPPTYTDRSYGKHIWNLNIWYCEWKKDPDWWFLAIVVSELWSLQALFSRFGLFKRNRFFCGKVFNLFIHFVYFSYKERHRKVADDTPRMCMI